MRYVNRKTGAVIETDCTIGGGLWLPEKEIAPAQTAEPVAAEGAEDKPAPKKRGGKK